MLITNPYGSINKNPYGPIANPATKIPGVNPLTSTPQNQTPVNMNWASGVKAWDPKGMFSDPATPSPQTIQNAPQNIDFRFNPVAHVDTSANQPQNISLAPRPPPQMQTIQNEPQNISLKPFAPPQMETPAAVQPPDPYTSPGPSQGFNPAAFTTQYGTLENLQPYMNPFLDQIIAKGNKAIESSAAARGGLLSSRTGQEIGDWSTGAASQAYNDARSAFNADRGYMTGVYQDGRNFDYNNFKDTNNLNWDVFKYGDAAQRNMLSDYYNQNQGLVNTGLNASGNAGNIQSNLMQSLAELYGNQGNVNAQGAVNGANNNSGLLQTILGGLLSAFGG